jgi:hypothetical protein
MLPFPPELVCAEENAVLAELARRGSTMRYDPRLAAFHERRATYKGFVRQMLKYGRGRGQLAAQKRWTARPAHFVPSALLAYLAVLPLLVWLSPLLALPVAAYIGAVGVSSAVIATKVRYRRAFPLAFALTVTLHACYGVGVLAGLLRPQHRRTRRGRPRRPGADRETATAGSIDRKR